MARRGSIPYLLAATHFLMGWNVSAQSVGEEIGEATPECGLVFLVSDLNDSTTQAGGTMVIPIRALNGCEIRDHVDVSFRYSPAVFNNAGIGSSDSFSATELRKTDKGFTNREFGPVRLTRIAPGQPGEIVFVLVLRAFNFPITTGPNTIEWTQFLVDGEVDLADSLRDPVITTAKTPSRPVLNLPGVISEASIEVRWFISHPIESVAEYEVAIARDSVDIASRTVDFKGTSAVFEGLEAGTEYEARLIARNAAGDSLPAIYSFTPSFTSAAAEFFLGLPRDWSPDPPQARTLQEAIPSPVDANLDGRVNAVDALDAIHRN